MNEARRQKALDIGGQLGNFRLERLLGGGGEATVYLARDVVLRRRVAVKLFDRANLSDANERALREARLIATLDHPNIVRIYHVGQRDGKLYIAMEYMDGGSLHERVRRWVGPLSSAEALQFMLKAALAMEEANRIGVLHRDVKPRNLLLSKAGVLKLADFGLAAVQVTKGGKAHGTVGTPQYMAPEIWQDKGATAKSDVYSLGACLYFLVTGRPPFVASSVEELKEFHLREQPAIPPDVPRPVAEVIWCCLAKAPEARPESAAELAELLAETLRVVVGERRRPISQPPITHDLPSSLSPGRGTRAAIMAVPLLFDCQRRLVLAVQSKSPMVVVHGPEAEILRRIAQVTLEGSIGRVFLAARLSIRSENQHLMQSLAECVHNPELPNATVKADPSSIIAALVESTSTSNQLVPMLVYVHFLRSVTQDEIAELSSLAGRAQKENLIFLVLCDDDGAAHLIRETGMRGYAGAVSTVQIPRLSLKEIAQFIHIWSAKLAADREIRWTADGLLLAAYLLSTGQYSLDRLVNNAIMIMRASHLPFLTSWCIFGAGKRRDAIQDVAEVRAEWSSPPTSWPDEKMAKLLQELRVGDRRPPGRRGR